MKSKPDKCADIPALSAAAENMVHNGRRRARTESQSTTHLSELSRIVERLVFSTEDHLRVQQQIEERALALWMAGGCRPGTALNDWLQAEREVLERFIRTYSRNHGLRQAVRPRESVRVARKKLEPRILQEGTGEVFGALT
jgi:hypothetical protein